MLWLFLKSSNNSSLHARQSVWVMLSESYILFGLWLHLLQHCCYQVARLIWVSIKWAHSCVIKLVNWRSCSCNSVAIELIVDLFMWHHHKWTSACFCMPSACSMQSIFDLGYALLCNWTVNLWMFLVRHHRNRNLWWLVLALHQRWTARNYNVRVPHCVSNMNTHGSLKLTLLCIEHDYTSLSKVAFTVLRA
jgi:hypothetical protein